MHGRVGGLAEAAGEVRRGKPSATGETRCVSEPRQHPVGVWRIEDASRDYRPSKVVAAGDRASECTFFAQGVRKLSSEKQCRSNFCQHITRCYAKNAPLKSFQKYRKSIPKPVKNGPGTLPEKTSKIRRQKR